MKPATLALFAALPALAACSSTSERGVEVRVLSYPLETQPEAPLTTDLGYQVVVHAAWWTNAEFELVHCVTAAERVLNLLVPSAHAHGTESPTLLSAPCVQDAFATAETELGVLTPPATRYCGLRYAVGPADADAHGLSAAPDMLDHAVRIQASFREPGGEYEALDVRGSTLSSIDFRDVSLELTERSSRATVHIERDAARWFDGVDFFAASAEQRERAVLQNFVTSVRLDVE